MTHIYDVYLKDPFLKVCEITDDGKVINSENRPECFINSIELLVSQVKRGVADKKVKKLRLVDVANKKAINLVSLFSKKNNNPNGTKSNLKAIDPSMRFVGRDWEADRGRISQMDSLGWSIGRMANELGVGRSALSKANKIYGFYQPRRFGPVERSI